MQVIFGFGQHHLDITKDWAYRLGDAIKGFSCKEEIKTTIDEYVKEAGITHLPTCDVRHVSVCEIQYIEKYEGNFVVVVEGKWCHIRMDHPMSPDGVAAMYVPFCLTVCVSPEDLWGTRVYVAI